MKKIRALLKLRGMTPAQLTRAANLFRSTMSRIMRGHIPSEETMNRIAEALEVSPGYLRGGYKLPDWLGEEDILTLADRRNLPYLRLVREAAEKGLTPEDMRYLMEVIETVPLTMGAVLFCGC